MSTKMLNLIIRVHLYLLAARAGERAVPLLTAKVRVPLHPFTFSLLHRVCVCRAVPSFKFSLELEISWALISVYSLGRLIRGA